MTAHRLAPVRSSYGFGLIELMIGITLATILLLGLSEVFSASRTAYNTAQGTAEVQENGRFALEFLERDARMAGHMGCVSDQARFLAVTPQFFSHFIASAPPYNAVSYATAPFYQRFDLSIQGFEAINSTRGSPAATLNLPVATAAPAWSTVWGGTAADQLPAGFPGPAGTPLPLANSAILLLRFFGQASAPVTNYNPGVFQITAPTFATQEAAEPAGMYGIANCINASVFVSTGVNAAGQITAGNTGLAPGNLTGFNAGAGEVYPTGELNVYRAESMAYYVALPAGRTVPSLFRVHYTASPAAPVVEEIVEGIDNMQIMYGVDSNPGALPDGGIDSYQTASIMNNAPDATLPGLSQIAAWQRVGTARIALLARSTTLAGAGKNAAGSPSGCATVANCYSMLGLNVVPPVDNNYREVYVTTIAMRNRLFGQ